jgi:hypothetical protein
MQCAASLLSGSVKVKCVIAIDEDCIAEIVHAMLPEEWRLHATFATGAQLTDVIEMLRQALPALLVIHTNLLVCGPEDGIAGCVAASPSTRYLFVTAWSEEHIDDLLRFCEHLHASFGVLRMPFDRAQLIAALEPALELLS